jgi:hypothetical protein
LVPPAGPPPASAVMSTMMPRRPARAIGIAGDTLRAGLTPASAGSRRSGRAALVRSERSAWLAFASWQRQETSAHRLLSAGGRPDILLERGGDELVQRAEPMGRWGRTRGAGQRACAYDSAPRSPSNGGWPTSISNSTQPSE